VAVVPISTSTRAGYRNDPARDIAEARSPNPREASAEQVGAHFIAVTDPGLSLEGEAKKLRAGNTFHGVPLIGGRNSVLTKFGLVPAEQPSGWIRGAWSRRRM
jgi:glucose-6-phosphate isomerase